MVLAICGYLGKYFSTNSSLVISLNNSLPFLTTKSEPVTSTDEDDDDDLPF